MKNISTALLLFILWVPLCAQDKPAPKLSGIMFGDYFYNISRDTGIASLGNTVMNGTRDFNGFQFRRIYLTYDADILPEFTSRFRLEGTTGAPFIKDAYLKWKNVFSGSELMFGLQQTPAFEISEGMWGYRSLEKTILDLRGFVTPRDLGISLRGVLDDNGIYGYWLMIGNNSSVGSETDKYKRIYAHIEMKPTEKIEMTLYADYRMKSDINDPRSTTVPAKTLSNNSITAALFIGYKEKNHFAIGVEGFYNILENGMIDTVPRISVSDKNAIGISLFGSYVLSEQFTFIGRYDYFDANIDDKAKGDSRNYVITGIDYKVNGKVSVIPNILIETYEEIPTLSGSRSVDASVTARVTLSYTFL